MELISLIYLIEKIRVAIILMNPAVEDENIYKLTIKLKSILMSLITLMETQE